MCKETSQTKRNFSLEFRYEFVLGWGRLVLWYVLEKPKFPNVSNIKLLRSYSLIAEIERLAKMQIYISWMVKYLDWNVMDHCISVTDILARLWSIKIVNIITHQSDLLR